MRLFILALLLPAYGFAAVHVEWGEDAMPPSETPVVSAADRDSTPPSPFLSELSDTTDDVCDHCMAHAVEVTVQRVRLWDLPMEQSGAPDAVPRQLLRPPCASFS